MKTSTIKSIYYISGICFIIAIWYISSIVVNNSGIIPSISEVIDKLQEILSDKNTYLMIATTIVKIVVTVLISSVISLILAVLSLFNYRIEAFIRPLIAFFRTVPVVSIAMIVLIIFFKQSVRFIGTILITSTVCIPLIYEGILTGFKTINSNIIDATKLLSNTNVKILMKVHIPLAFPAILTSVIQSFGLGLKVLVMSEVIVNPPNSIGRLIGEYASYGELSYVFGWTIILVVIVLSFDICFKKMKIMSWD